MVVTEAINYFPRPIIIVFLLLFLLVPLALKLIISVFVAKDAKKSNVQSPALWGLACFILPLVIGLPLYFIVKFVSKEKTSQYCLFCGKMLAPDFNVCPYCGKPQKKVCPNCKAPVKSDWNNCVNCGTSLKD